MLGNFGTEQRSLSYQTIWGSGGDFFGANTEAGSPINQESAFRITAFYACTLLISDTISTLPMDVFYRRDGERLPFRPKPAWVDKPDVEISRTEHFQQVLVSLLVDGNGFVRIYRDSSGNVANLVALNPARVQVRRNRSRQIEYIIDENEDKPVAAEDMLHLTELRKANALRGTSRVDELRDNLGLSTALQTFASKFFAQGAITSGVIEAPGAMTSEQAKNLVDGFNAKHKGTGKAHKTGLLTGGAKFNRTGVNPDEAQMLESRKLAIEEIARIFLVPPHMIGITTPGAQSYASIEQNNINFVVHTLRRYIAKIEEAYSTLLPNGAFLRINVDGLLRGDFITRMQGYSIGTQAGFLSVNDIHRLEDMRPVDGGDVYRVPLANVDLAAANLVETDKKVTMAQKLILAGFEPAAVLSALQLPEIAHTGVPSTQLQAVAQIDPESPTSVYKAE